MLFSVPTCKKRVAFPPCANVVLPFAKIDLRCFRTKPFRQ